MATGRFAPSPTGDLHLGNLRTAFLAWLFARSSGGRFLVRVEDLDPLTSSIAHERAQLADLRSIGLDWDGPVVRQSERRDRHEWALGSLVERGLTYECWCSRREVREAAAAPHVRPGTYPGTCRALTSAQRSERAASGRPAALRLRAEAVEVSIVDRLHGPIAGPVDDIVLRRNDGVPAYNLAVVVDDHDQGVQQVIRGADLLDATVSQAHLASLLGFPRPEWAHVPLVFGPDGNRLAKRHGAVTLGELTASGWTPAEILGLLATSLGLSEAAEPVTPIDIVERFDPDALPTSPWTLDPHTLVR